METLESSPRFGVGLLGIVTRSVPGSTRHETFEHEHEHEGRALENPRGIADYEDRFASTALPALEAFGRPIA